MLGANDDALAGAQAVAELAFGADPVLAGAGPEERDLAEGQLTDLGFLRDRMRRGLTAMAVAESEQDGPLGVGSHQPVGDVSEITGVGTLPAARRRGIGAAVTGRLVEHARERGAAIVFLSAADEDVARLYERLGFRRVGTACFGRARES